VMLRLLDLNLEPELVAAQTVITPACGLASATRDGALRALRTLRKAAHIVTEQLVA
jgi:methionine synthase II (cobalamin-independent)